MKNRGNTDFIRKIDLANFRCHPDGQIGPFARFNLFFGRNGSGKTSLMEAIEIGLTGASYRVAPDQDLAMTISRERKTPVNISLDGPAGTISKFVNGKLTPSKTDLLQLLYGIKAHSQKSRYLLGKLFSVHNILYSEEVVEFLKAGSRRMLQEVIQEITLGRDVIDRWGYLSAAKNSLNRIVREYEDQAKRYQDEIDLYTESLEELGKLDESTTRSLRSDLLSKLPIEMQNRSLLKNQKASSTLLRELRQLGAQLKESSEKLGKLVEFFVVYERPKTWGSVITLLESKKSEKSVIDKRYKDLTANKDKLNRKMDQLETEQHAVEERIADIVTRIESLKSCKDASSKIIDWLPEFTAESLQNSLFDDISESKEKTSVLDAVSQLMESLPTQTQQEILDREKAKNEKTLRTLTRRRTRSLNEKKEFEEQLREGVRRLKQSSEKQKELWNSVVELNSLVTSYLQEEIDSSCPACGHSWPSPAALENAVASRFKDLKSKLKSGDLERNTWAEEKNRLQTEIKKMTTLVNELESSIEKLRRDMKESAEKRLLTEETLDEIIEMLDSIAIQLVTKPKPRSLVKLISALPVTTIKSEQKKCHKVVLRLELQETNAWRGLREQEYDKNKKELQEILEHLTRIAPDLNIRVPDDFKVGKWESFLTNLDEMIERAENEHKHARAKYDMNRKKKKQYDVELKRNNKEVSRLEVERKSLEKDIVSYLQTTKDVNVLQEHGIVNSKDTIREETVEKRISVLRTQTEALTQHVSSQLESKKQGLGLRKKRSSSIAQQKVHMKRQKTATNLRKKFEIITPLEEFQIDVWNQYAEMISDIFKKLHWPPDFERIELARDGEELDLKVTLRPSREIRSANERMSAGQRAALAISAFWALNSARSKTVPVLLMDEPIQSVDDLNILNFLDGLRWLVERENRQIFLSTANQRVRGLIRRKFSYLGEEFREFFLSRNGPVSSIQYIDAQERILEFKNKIA